MSQADKPSVELLGCPFCGRDFGDDLDDTLYPTGTYWVERPDIGRHYFSHRDRVNYPDAHQCWNVVCNESSGGCGAEAHGDSMKETVAKWNRRQSAAAPPIVDLSDERIVDIAAQWMADGSLSIVAFGRAILAASSDGEKSK